MASKEKDNSEGRIITNRNLVPFFTLTIYIILIIFIFPFYIYRTLIYLLVKSSDLNISKMMTGLSASLLRDHDKHEEKPLSTIVVCLRGSGEITLGNLRELIRTRIILKRDSKTKELQFPELRQYYVKRMGYMFLKWDTKFDLTNHVKCFESGKRMSRNDLLRLWEDLMVKPFENGRSPWEIISVKNVDLCEEERESAVIFLRIHHGIADGFSVQKLLLSLDPNYRYSRGGVCGGSKWSRFKMFCRTAIFGPYDLSRRILIEKEPFHSFHLSRDELLKEYFVLESGRFDVNEVKRIKNFFGVSYSTVLISVVSGAIRQFLKGQKRPFPPLQRLGIPFATRPEGADEKLRNDFLIAPLKIPIHLERVHERMQNIQEQLEALHHSSVTQMLGVTIDCLSCLPVDLMKSLTTKSLFSTAFSMLPGPVRPIRIPGAVLEEVGFTYGTGAASLGLCFSSITYLDSFRITLFVDKALMKGKRECAEDMVQSLTEEFMQLSELAE